jgi:hypothetical protein
MLSASVFAYTYEISSGYFGDLNLTGNQTLLMTGGGYTLMGHDNSILDIRNTSSPIVRGESGLGNIILGDNSQLYISGGSVHLLDLFSNTTTTLTGGQIDIINGYYVYPIDTSRITVYCQSGWTYQNSYLSGLWLDNSAFNIKLVTKASSDVFSNITIIPEPASLLLLAVGGLLLRHRRS